MKVQESSVKFPHRKAYILCLLEMYYILLLSYTQYTDQWLMGIFNSGMSQSYTSQRDKNLLKHTRYGAGNKGFSVKNPDPSSALIKEVNFVEIIIYEHIIVDLNLLLSLYFQMILFLFHSHNIFHGAFTQLSEQISSLNDRMDEFTNRIEELNSKLRINKNSSSQQAIAFLAEGCNGSAPTSHFISSLENGSITRSIMKSSSSLQLTKEPLLFDEVFFYFRLSLCPYKIFFLGCIFL